MRSAICVLLLAFLAGCVVTAERDGLPTGVTLLDSEDAYCDGPIEIDADPDVVIDQGESATVALDDDDNVDWECQEGSDSDDGEFDCPDGTSYVRITREEDDADFTVECFGS
jgi:hypothetical protein